MKHTLKITLVLVILFFLAQLVGLAVVNEYIDHKSIEETGQVEWQELPYDISRPIIEENTSFMYILAAILIGTVLVLLLIRFKKVRWWKTWYFIAVWFCMTIALAAFIPQFLALIFSFILASLKAFKPGLVIHNLTELFVYGGLAAIFVPVMNLFAAFMLLFLISAYDMYAVWKSKHMIKLAKFQSKSKVFAGLLIPYKKGAKQKKGAKLKKVRTAVLGGGDIGFPLLFAGVVMKDLMLNNTILIGFLKSLIIPLFVSIALYFLLIKGEKDKFYPAMPFLSLGCLVGYLVILLL